MRTSRNGTPGPLKATINRPSPGEFAAQDHPAGGCGGRLLGVLGDLNQAKGNPEASATLARACADIEGLRLGARGVTCAGIHPMRGNLFSLLATGGSFGPETAAALAAIEEDFRDHYARRNRSGIFH